MLKVLSGSHDALGSVRPYTHRINRDELPPYCESRLKYPLGSCKEACTMFTGPTFSLLLTRLLSHLILFFSEFQQSEYTLKEKYVAQ